MDIQGCSFLSSHDQLLEDAKVAAREGDPRRMVEALFQSHAFDGVKRRLNFRYREISEQDIDLIICEALDVLYSAVRNGDRVFNIVAYLWRVADRKAIDYLRFREKEQPTDPEELAQIADERPVVNPFYLSEAEEIEAREAEEEEEDRKEEEKKELRRKGIEIFRSLIPKLGMENVQSVMKFYLEAVEDGRVEVTNEDISEALGLTRDTVRTCLSRGFKRLAWIAHEEGLTIDLDKNLIERENEEVTDHGD
jgi:DNA-directed RNA polymerase specialized sigma24 family protein